MSAPEFWTDRQRADELIKELGQLQDVVSRFDQIEKTLKELEVTFSDPLFFETKKLLQQFELEQLFTGRYDGQSAIVSLFPGAGGEDAEDWARMLFEMYSRFCQMRGWQMKLLDEHPNRRTFEVKGQYAYGYLKYEAGVHRLVRISPFNAKGLRHTSFALVEVVPDLPQVEASKLVIPEKDLKVEFTRSGGPGGQNVNKVETAVRIMHVPTGLSAGSETQRSQAQNREAALSLLKAKLFHLMQQNQAKELSDLRVKVKPEWGSQIRSYVLNPYQMVKDHRTNIETGNVEEVLEGNLDKFIEAEVELLR